MLRSAIWSEYLTSNGFPLTNQTLYFPLIGLMWCIPWLLPSFRTHPAIGPTIRICAQAFLEHYNDESNKVSCLIWKVLQLDQFLHSLPPLTAFSLWSLFLPIMQLSESHAILPKQLILYVTMQRRRNRTDGRFDSQTTTQKRHILENNVLLDCPIFLSRG